MVSNTLVLMDGKDEEEVIVFPEKVLQRRVQQTASGSITEVLIKWLDRDKGEATWERLDDMKTCFPEADLDDKVNAEGGSC